MNQVQSEGIDVEVNGIRLVGYLAKPPVPGPGIMVLHAWWGLTDFFKGLCDRLAEQGFTAFAPDLSAGKTAQTVEEAEKLMEERDLEKTKATATAAIAWFRDQQAMEGQGARLGLVGFSMGAAWALELASQAADAVKALVLFYGVSGADFPAIRAHIQGHYAVKDVWDKIEWSYEMEADMKAAGLQVEFFRYPDAGHWFFESNHPEAFNEKDAALAWERTLAFLKQELAGTAA